MRLTSLRASLMLRHFVSLILKGNRYLKSDFDDDIADDITALLHHLHHQLQQSHFDPFDSSNAVDTDLVAASSLQICTIWSSLVRYSESSEISWLLLLFGKKCSFECGVSFYSCTVTFCDETLDFGLLHVYSILLISPHHKHQKQYIYNHNFSNITYIYFWILHLSASEHDTLMPHRQVY